MKRHILAAIPLTIALAATAHGNVAITPACDAVTLTGFRPAALPLSDVTITSDAGTHRSGPYAGPGWTIPVPTSARGTVRASASDGYTTWTSDACLIAVPPTPTPGPATPPAPQGPGVGEPADSSTRRVEPMPRKEGARKPAKRVTPARRCPPEKAGRRWHIRARAKWGCAMPSRFRVVRSRVGVTG